MSLVYLEDVEVGGKAAAFRKGHETFFLALRGDAAADEEGLCAGDVFAVEVGVDVEPGDLVVWWSGSARTQALARVQEDLELKPVGGFPAPPKHPTPSVRGVVVGRLRSFAS